MAETTQDPASPKISLIVPVYKVEQYLRRCLDSIASQTFTDWECILIDDGSPDKSGAICDEYAGRDSRFRVIHQENKGVSAARNAGLDAAQGEWIGFVDSDDWVEKEMIEALLSVKDISSTELVICSVKDTLGLGTFMLPSDIDKKDWRNALSAFLPSACAKAFRREIIEKNRLRFPVVVKLGEDTCFVYMYLSNIHSISFIKEPFYTYFISNEESATHNISEDTVKDFENLVRKLETYIAERNRREEFSHCLYNLKMNVKNRFLFSLEKPDFKSWRTSFAEINSVILKNEKSSLKLFVFYAQILAKRDFLAWLIFKAHKTLTKIMRRGK